MGDWKAAKDPKGRIYYYNTVTKKSTWEKPKNFAEPDQPSANDWKTGKTKDGKTYYYNVKTRESRWTLPPEMKQEEKEEARPNKDSEKIVENLTSSNDKYKNDSKILNVASLPKEQAEPIFMQMLKDNQVDSTWSFNRIISELSTTDARYWCVDDDPVWKQQVFEKYLSNRTEDQLLKEHSETNKFKQAFDKLLASNVQSGKLTEYTTWSSFKKIILDEPIYKHSVIDEGIKRKAFENFTNNLRNQRQAERDNLKKQALEEFRIYLKSILFNGGSELKMISWHNLLNNYLFEKNKRFMANPNFKILTHEDTLIEYLKLLSDFENDKLKIKLSELNEKNYTTDRIARDKYKKLLSGLSIKANTKWSEVYDQIKNDPIFFNMLGRNGSNAVDLFLDIVEEQKIILSAKRSIAQQILITNNFEWSIDNESDDANKIRQILLNNVEKNEYEKEDIELLIIELVKVRNAKKQEQVALARQNLEQKKYYLTQSLQRYYRGLNRKLIEDWEEAKEQLKDVISEYNELEEDVLKDTYAKFISNFDKQGTVQSKKRPLAPTVELDY
ncbi:hypothetical protein KAFR_0A00230 [Kazachstania africana CBS 2517]|uniref:WW domain-containing protein n=1 Tax=Kazachstania africana (strain ATCC 22294 / BCRC 22015 / CBS 2517 / CECT 1963 / NBRC 1671 / NRRL Y-8276) TaxID=1071382 RepID=H2AM61_KAZAF|nr:hypothetical protein KAFR_0A00230 [Kazachstania africana CBS 2517]CCF55461.1 hypothetical protein KAFR_0A00230 [Kazachstania africana CBS 2517]